MQSCILPNSTAPTCLEWHRLDPGQAKLRSHTLLERDYALMCPLGLYSWQSPYSHVTQPDLCLPLNSQEMGERKTGWQKEMVLAVWVVVRGLDAAGSQFEVSLKTGRYSYIPSEKRIHCSFLSVLELACASSFVYW